MTRALTLAAIEQCERDGHLFRWVRAWHDCGFYECERCGETRKQVVICHTDGVGVDVAAGGDPVSQWFTDEKSGKTCRIVLGPDGKRIGFDVLSGCTVRDCSPPSATVHDCPESVRRTPPDGPPLSAPTRGRGAPPKAQRNAEIVRRLAQGESVESVRQAFGLSWQRIYQIKAAAKRKPHTIGEPPGLAAPGRREPWEKSSVGG